jgi:hypothetical protein
MASKEQVNRRLEFLGINGAEARRLQALHPLLVESSETLVTDFYRHLLSFPETSELVKDPQRGDRLLREQRAYLLGLTSGPVDDEYVEERRRMGEAHVEAGLPPGLFLRAASHYFSMLAYMIEDTVYGDVEQLRLILVSLARRILLDTELSMDAYFEGHTRRLRYLNEQLARELRDAKAR